MSQLKIRLPKDKDILPRIINNHVNRELSRTAYWRLTRIMYHHYLQGARHFSEFNVHRGSLYYNFTDENGNLYFRSGKLMQKINQFIGHSMSGDWRPSVIRTDLSLAGIRERAVCQTILDAVVTPRSLSNFLTDVHYYFWAMGGVGIYGDVVTYGQQGLVADMQAIHPTELFPFPSVQVDRTRAAGLLWRHYMSEDEIKDKIGARKFNQLRSQMQHIRVNVGETETKTGIMGAVAGRGVQLQGSAWGANGTTNQNDKTFVELFEVRELWVDGESGFAERYIAQSGQAILVDDDRTNQGFFCPIRYLRCFDDGTWHGQGLTDLLFGHVREEEKSLAYMLENIRSESKFDLLVLPQSAFDQDSAFRDTGKGLKIVTWSPDPFSDNQRPFTVRQATSGEIPGKVTLMLDQMVEQMAFPEILQGNAPGRVDSTSGLEFLDEQARKSLNGPIGNMQQGFGALYQAMAAKAIKTFGEAGFPVPVSRLTPEMAGVVIDPKTSSVKLAGGVNPLPDPSRLVFTVKDAAPKNPAALKQEAREYLTAQQMTVTQYQYYLVQNGLDAAMPLDRVRNAYEKAVRNTLVLFNDGEAPGEVVATPVSNYPEVDLMVLGDFMCSITFQQASPKVQNAFSAYYQDLQTQNGLVLPAGYTNPDDAIIQRAANVSAPFPQQQGP